MNLESIDLVRQLVVTTPGMSPGTKKVILGYLECDMGLTTKGTCYASDQATVTNIRIDTDVYRMRALGFRTFLMDRAPG